MIKNNMKLNNYLKKLYIHNDIKIFGWASTKLYNQNKIYKIKLTLYALFYSSKIKLIDFNKNKKKKILFFYGDYASKSEHHFNMIKFLKLTVSNNFEVSDFKIINRLSFINFFKKLVLTLNFYFNVKNKDSLSNKLMFSCLAAKGVIEYRYYDSIIKKFLNYNPIVINFCDAIGEENIIAQVSNKSKLKTITLQHGQYNINKKKTISADDESYNNFVSTYMFCWGKETIKELTRSNIDRKRFFVTGLLKKKLKKKYLLSNKKKNTFGVVLSGNNQTQYNLDLINFSNHLSKEYNLNYFIRMHPSNHEIFIRKFTNNKCLKVLNYKNKENNKYFRACDFTLIGRSGFYLDCIEFKKKFIFYDNGSLPNFLKSSKISINHTKQLIYKLKLFNNNDIYYSLKNKYNDDINQKYKINNFLMKLCTV